MKFSASILALALLVITGFAAPLAAQAPAVDLPDAEASVQPAPPASPETASPETAFPETAEVEPAAAGDLLGLDNPLATPDVQELSCQYTCPTGNPFVCPVYWDRPFPSCVGGCCVYY
ncbi:MAG: hypothetical protein SX243_15445 [Acidobacteriota bacterium]|nr:hypothetical protein [Acidobacteriota bacterium]